MGGKRGSYVANFLFLCAVGLAAGGAFAIGFYYTYGATANVTAKVPVGLPSLKPIPRASSPRFAPTEPPASPGGVEPSRGQQSTLYRVQVGAFEAREDAESLIQTLQSQGVRALVVYDEGAYRAQLGVFSTKERAVARAGEINARGYSVRVRG